MNVKRIEVLTNRAGTDLLYLELEADTPFPGTTYTPYARVETNAGYGHTWAQKSFPGVEVVVIDTKTGARTVIKGVQNES